jgi:hypothetical protein
MPAIFVYGLTPAASNLHLLERALIDAVASIPELAVSPSQVSVYMPALLIKPKTADIWVTVELFAQEARTPEVLGRLARTVGETIERVYGGGTARKKSLIEVRPVPFDHEVVGFWSNEGPACIDWDFRNE